MTEHLDLRENPSEHPQWEKNDYHVPADENTTLSEPEPLVSKYKKNLNWGIVPITNALFDIATKCNDHLQEGEKALKGIAKFDKIIKYGLQI